MFHLPILPDNPEMQAFVIGFVLPFFASVAGALIGMIRKMLTNVDKVL